MFICSPRAPNQPTQLRKLLLLTSTAEVKKADKASKRAEERHTSPLVAKRIACKLGY